MAPTQKITTYLWFNDNAEEAVEFYTSVFADSRVTDVARWGEGTPGPQGAVLNIVFELAGQRFIALNGGPAFRFTPAISLFVSCESQLEVDDLWTKLIADGGREDQCGWLKDKFGLSWQIIPKALPRLLRDPNPKKAQAAMQAMLGMKKIIVADLEKAAASA